MPTYDYRCTACGHTFELFQSMTAKHEKKCPKCGKNALERLIGTGAAVLFKGSGFYQTDYRSDGYKKAADADKPAEPAKADSAKDSSKAEAKPDVKSDAKPETKSDSSSGTKSDSGTASKSVAKISSKPIKPAANATAKSAKRPKSK